LESVRRASTEEFAHDDGSVRDSLGLGRCQYLQNEC
jgi:hypothetical protein